MRRIITTIAFVFLLIFGQLGFAEEDDSSEFRSKLVLMLTNVEKSINIIRRQISESRKTAFLPDLYFELANLLAQKSTTLYYLGKEKEKAGETESIAGKHPPIVTASQKESNSVLDLILEEFPQYSKRSEVLYSLAIGLNAIDEAPRFRQVIKQLKKEYPNSEYAIKGTLLLGQYLFDRQMYDEAISEWEPITHETHMHDERNLAKYRMGVALTRKNKDKAALKYFEEVATDSNIKAKQDEVTVSLEKRRASDDIRREALLDSIIPFTNVFGTTVDPVKYYSSLSPSESIFQEIIEKLAFRYVFLKKYEFSIKLLRTLSLRISDVQKIIVIYYDVLRMIPFQSRLEINPDEMKYVLERLNYWQTYYSPDANLRDQVNNFFELQLRELGTRAHAALKNNKNDKKMLAMATDYYKLYLAYFSPSELATKIGANLGDLYLEQKDFFKCGNYYLETATGTYGNASDKITLIRNAVGCLDQESEGSYYEQIRKRALLIRAIEAYQKIDPKTAKDSGLQFAYARAVFDTGNLEKGIEFLKSFITRFPTSDQAITSGEIILDYYNKLEDYSGLSKATKFLSGIGLKDVNFIKRINIIQNQATAKLLQEKIKAFSDYDDFSQGKSYLQVAASSEDNTTKNIALQTALEKSRTEADFSTFFQAAILITKNEKDGNKRAGILLSVGKEKKLLGLYSEAFATFLEISKSKEASDTTRRQAFEEAINTAILGKDIPLLALLKREVYWESINGSVKRKVSSFLLDVITSPVEIGDDGFDMISDETSSEQSIPTLLKVGTKLPKALRTAVIDSLDDICSRGRQRLACRWNAFLELDKQYNSFKNSLLEGKKSPDNIEKYAKIFQFLWSKYQELQGSRDPELESAIVLRCRWLFYNFAKYLEAIAHSNQDMTEVLMGKVKESLEVSAKYLEACSQVVKTSSVYSPAGSLCASNNEPIGDQLYAWQNRVALKGLAEEHGKNAAVKQAQIKAFTKKKAEEAQLELAEAFYREGAIHHAAATAQIGIAIYPANANDFRAILGCAVLEMNMMQEAVFHLKKANDYHGLKSQCSRRLK